MDYQKRTLIVNHLAGVSTKDQEKELEEWLASSPENNRQYEIIKGIWLASAAVPADAAWQTSFKKLKLEIEKQDQADNTIRRIPAFKFWGIAAAAALTCIVLAASLFFLKRPSENIEMVLLERSTGPGEVLHLTLPDSTEIWLNGNSRIRFPASFSAAAVRAVTLYGEAFFKVKHKEKQPFVVSSGALKTTVLGTSFNITAYQDAKRQEVTVLTGMVSVSNNSASEDQIIRLLPSQKAVFEQVSGKMLKADTHADDVIAWREGRLVFDRTAMDEVFEVLERKYDVRIEAEPGSFKDCRLTASFGNISLSELLNTLKKTLDISYTQHHNHISIKGGNCM